MVLTMMGAMGAPLDPAPAQAFQPVRRCIRTSDSDFDRSFALRTPAKATELDCSRMCAEAPGSWCVGHRFEGSSGASSTCTLFDDCSQARADSAVRLSRSRVEWSGSGFRPYSPEQQPRIERLTGRSHLWGHPEYKCPSLTGDAAHPEDATCARCVQHNSAKPNCCSPGGAWEGHCDEPDGRHSWSEGFRACSGALDVPVKARNGRPVVYTHLHKAGGTMICELAKRNEEKLPPNNSNCNMYPDDNWEGGVAPDPSAWPPTTSVGCAQRQQLVRDHSVTWMSQERWVDDERCDDFYHAITLRDPLDRIVSNFMHTRYRAKMHPDQIGAQTSRHNSMNVSADDVMACVFPGAHCYHRRFFIEWSTGAYDNFFVRTLAGPGAFFLPAGALTREHLEVARAALQRFDVIMMLDGLDEDSAQMSDLLGWNVTTTNVTSIDHENTREGHFAAVGEAADPMPFKDEQLRQLFEVNQLDYELLCYAQAMRASRLAVLAARSSENGQSKQRSSEDRQTKQHKSTKQESRKQKNHGKQKSHGKQDGRQQHRKQKQNRDGERLVGIAPVGFQKREP